MKTIVLAAVCVMAFSPAFAAPAPPAAPKAAESPRQTTKMYRTESPKSSSIVIVTRADSVRRQRGADQITMSQK